MNSDKEFKVLFLVGGEVGSQIADWTLSQYPNDVAGLVYSDRNYSSPLALGSSLPIHHYSNDDEMLEWMSQEVGAFSILVLAWWPNIIGEEILSLPLVSTINMHPSFLPHGRGKNYNFWALVEQSKFGVTLHEVNPGIDSGNIISQKEITYDWTDNGGSLYRKALAAVPQLWKSQYDSIRNGEYPTESQDLTAGSFHLGNEMEQMSTLDLNDTLTVRETLNLLRARTFPGRPACRFTDESGTFEVRVEIVRLQNESEL